MCSVVHIRTKTDLEHATVKDLVETLQSELGYGEEFSLSNDLGTFYDPDLEDNLPKKLGDLGVQNEGFITVVDEEDDEPRVNIQLLVLAER